MGAGEFDPGSGAAPPNPYPIGQCTWGVWQYVYDHFGVAMPDLPGNATDWVHDAKQRGWKVVLEPTVNTAVVWSSAKYAPYGHVAWVTGIQSEGTPPGEHRLQTVNTTSFTVYEFNFNSPLAKDTRTIKVPSSDTQGIEGFIEVPGVTPGASNGDPIGSPAGTDPWAEFTAGIQATEQQAQQQITSAFDQIFAGGEVLLGGAVMVGGVWLLSKAVRGERPSLPSRQRSRPTPALPAATRTVPNAETVEAARDVTFGKESRVEASVRSKVAAGKLSSMTPAETDWMRAHPAEVRAAFQAAGARTAQAAMAGRTGRITAAARTRIL